MRWIIVASLVMMSGAFAQNNKEPTLQELMEIQLPEKWELWIKSETAPKKPGGLYDGEGPTDHSVRRRLLMQDPDARKAAIDIWKSRRAEEKRKIETEKAKIAEAEKGRREAARRTQDEEIRFNNIPIQEPTTEQLMSIRLPDAWERKILAARGTWSKTNSPPGDNDPDREAQDVERRWILDNDTEARSYAVQEWKKAERSRLLRLKREQDAKRKQRYAKIPPMYDESKSTESVVTNCGRESPEEGEQTPFVFLRITKDYQKNGAYIVRTGLYLYPDKKSWSEDPSMKKSLVFAMGSRRIFSDDQISSVAYGVKYGVDYERFANDFLSVDMFGGSVRGTDAMGSLRGDIALISSKLQAPTIYDFARMNFDIEGYQKLQTYPAEKEVYDPTRLEGEIEIGELDSDPTDRTKLKFTPHPNQSFKNIVLRCSTGLTYARP